MRQNTFACCYIDSLERQSVLAILNGEDLVLYCLGSQNITSIDCSDTLNCARILSRWPVGQSETQQSIAISCRTILNHTEIFIAYKNNGDLQCRTFCYDSNLLEKEIYSRKIFPFKIKDSAVRNVCNVSFLNGRQILFVVNGDTLMISDIISSADDDKEMTNRRDSSNDERNKYNSDFIEKDINNGNEPSPFNISRPKFRKEVACHKLSNMIGFNKSYNLLQPDSTIIRDVLIINENDGDIAMIIKSKFLYAC